MARRVQVLPHWMPDGYWLYADGGSWTAAPDWYYNMLYCWERRRGLTAVDNHFSPGHFHVTLPPGGEVTIRLTLTPPATSTHGASAIAALPLPRACRCPGQPPEEIRQLFHARRLSWSNAPAWREEELAHGRTVIAGYHWFGDWGRDTMIALPG